MRMIYAGLSGFVVAFLLIAAASCAPRDMAPTGSEWDNLGDGLWERQLPNGVNCYRVSLFNGNAVSCVRN